MRCKSAMYPKLPYTAWYNHGHPRGFAMVSAIFLLVVLTALGAFMVTFSTAQHATSAQDVMGTRAAQAARAGIEWGSYQVLTPVSAPAAAACTINPLALAGNLAGFTVVVTCIASGPFVENGNSITIYNITSTASSGIAGSSTYVERQFQATLSR